MPAKGLNHDSRFMHHRMKHANLGHCWLVWWNKYGPYGLDWCEMQIAG